MANIALFALVEADCLIKALVNRTGNTSFLIGFIMISVNIKKTKQ